MPKRRHQPNPELLVMLLTSGMRCSLRRALIEAGYSPNHESGWDQILKSRKIMALFAEAHAAHRPMPWKMEDAIIKRLAEIQVEELL